MCFNSYLKLGRNSQPPPNDGNEPGEFAELAIIQVEREDVFVSGSVRRQITSFKDAAERFISKTSEDKPIK